MLVVIILFIITITVVDKSLENLSTNILVAFSYKSMNKLYLQWIKCSRGMPERGDIVQCARASTALSTAKRVPCPWPTLLSYPLIAWTTWSNVNFNINSIIRILSLSVGFHLVAFVTVEKLGYTFSLSSFIVTWGQPVSTRQSIVSLVFRAAGGGTRLPQAACVLIALTC